MYDIIQKAHSGLAYLALLALVIAVVNSIIGLVAKKEFTPLDRKIGIITLSLIHTQLVIGFIVWFISPLGMASLGQMKNAALRLTSLEHPVTNIIAIALITIGWVKHKTIVNSKSKFKTFFIYYGLGLVLILSKIPWRSWFN